jgi:rhamnosyltransferase
VLVVDSSSTDGTAEKAEELGAETLVIPRHEFNHGTTREKARKHLGTDIVVMVTQDAYAVDNEVIGNLIEPIYQKKVSVAYARQIPHDGAGFLETFPRDFNYPITSHVRQLSDTSRYGIYTFFCSNAFAAYSNSALDEIGGFKSVLFGEDTVAVAELLRHQHKVAYVAEALVKHSHDYTLREEFRRNYDIGLARAQYGHLLACEGSDSQRGKDFVIGMFKRLFREQPLLMPYASLHILAKWLGYRLGQWKATK